MAASRPISSRRCGTSINGPRWAGSRAAKCRRRRSTGASAAPVSTHAAGPARRSSPSPHITSSWVARLTAELVRSRSMATTSSSLRFGTAVAASRTASLAGTVDERTVAVVSVVSERYRAAATWASVSAKPSSPRERLMTVPCASMTWTRKPSAGVTCRALTLPPGAAASWFLSTDISVDSRVSRPWSRPLPSRLENRNAATPMTTSAARVNNSAKRVRIVMVVPRRPGGSARTADGSPRRAPSRVGRDGTAGRSCGECWPRAGRRCCCRAGTRSPTHARR